MRQTLVKMNMAGWWEWGQYKRQQHKTYTREAAERSIVWEVPRSRFRLIASIGPPLFVYLLKEHEGGAVRYIGMTDDPPRRCQEHQRAGMLNGRFRMVVVAEGGKEVEQHMIAKYLAEGCNLLNVAGVSRPI